MIPRTIDEMVDELSRSPMVNPVYTANYGDGEWGCILGDEGVNVNGDVYGRSGVRQALRQTLTEPLLTWYGYNPGKKLVGRVEAWLKQQGFCVPIVDPCGYAYRSGRVYKRCSGIFRMEGKGKWLPWMWKEVLSGANCKGEFAPFLRLCREKPVVIVGGSHLGTFAEFFNTHILTPSANTFDQAQALTDRLEKLCVQSPPHLILFACGIASNILIWNLAQRRVKAHLVDVGAALDPYVGILSRKTYRQPDFQERLQRSREEARV